MSIIVNSKEDQPKQSIFDGAKRLLCGLPKIAASVVGLSAFAYLLGWIYAQSYFSVFGAKWLSAEIPTLTIIGYSWWPVVGVLFFAYLGITDLVEIENEFKNVEDSFRFKTTLKIFNYGRWVFLAVAIADIVTGMFGHPILARILSFLVVCIVIMLATSAFEILAFQLIKPDMQINLPIVRLTYAIIFFGLYLAPNQMGHNAALQDKESEISSLSSVLLRNESTIIYRLLMSAGERFYIFPEKYEGKYPPIQIVTPLQIQSIQKRTNSEKDSIGARPTNQ